ncbi:MULTISPECIES: hypothetical protein [unclassified Novosphingobium]|uniref:hypothetical protein n=1 Tax=unclassified Novosphingobium TaxID=2644732 RepID=UPI00146EA70D|nr:MULTISPECIES: hypothetical protein [unclassified Novosphingobium]NMN07539.1 hypothetical protein [Novosphingobium sp. SG919]NMN89858.1 hypothetical protein [Novosphingobium sp. SG916]
MANDRDASGAKPTEVTDGTRDRVESDRRLKMAAEFRKASQAERVANPAMNAAAKNVAAMNAVVDSKYGAASPEAQRMRRATVEVVAKAIEAGQPITAPKIKDLREERRREIEDRQARDGAADRGDRER